jgi:hypothetical protein
VGGFDEAECRMWREEIPSEIRELIGARLRNEPLTLSLAVL